MSALRERIYRFAMELKQHDIGHGLEPALALSRDDYYRLLQDIEIWERVPFDQGCLRMYGIRLFPAEPWPRK